MKTAITISDPFISAMHEAIIKEYDCRLCHIIGAYDSMEKKIVVFVLRHFYSYDQRAVCIAYNTNFYFVPTIVQQMQLLYGESENFRDKLNRILDHLEHYNDGNISTMDAVA